MESQTVQIGPQLAEALGVTLAESFQLIDAGEITPFQPSANTPPIVSLEEIQSWVRQRTQEAKDGFPAGKKAAEAKQKADAELAARNKASYEAKLAEYKFQKAMKEAKTSEERRRLTEEYQAKLKEQKAVKLAAMEKEDGSGGQ